MHSWKTTRTWAAVLLLLPIVHLSILVSRDTLRVLDGSPKTWESEVQAYARSDSLGPLPKSPVVMVGGRRVALWEDLEDLLAPMPVLNRYLGDATTDDISFYYQKLIGFYQPHTVVLFPGESEFHIRDNKSASELVSAIQALVDLDLSHGITEHFYVITPLKTPRHKEANYKIDEISRELKSWAAEIEQVSILDANTLLSDRYGTAKPSYYRSDGIHLNEHGYVRLSVMLRAQMERDSPEIYTASSRG